MTERAQEEVRRALSALYGETSKHAQYQTLPESVALKLGLQFDVNEEWRGDRTRYPVIRQAIAGWGAKSVIDVGANTGFFTLSIAEDFPAVQVTACEPNAAHAEIVRLLAEVAGRANVTVTETPASLSNLQAFESHDVVLHLNILHHAGSDFDKALVASVEDFERYGVSYLAALRQLGSRLVFQMGYNWGGNKELPIVQRDDQAGKVEFNRRMLESAGWHIDAVAFASGKDPDQPISYDRHEPGQLPHGPALQGWLEAKYDTRVWSEFYQRPIWFCRL